MPHRTMNSLIILIAGSPKIGATERTLLISELQQVGNIKRMQPQKRRLLLQLVHSLRAFDSSLAYIADFHGCVPQNRSMGGYLTEFSRARAVPAFNQNDRQYFQRRLVNRRNALMHKAGEYPAGNNDAISLIGHMVACISKLV